MIVVAGPLILTFDYTPESYRLDPRFINERTVCIYDHKTVKRIECQVHVDVKAQKAREDVPGDFAVTVTPKLKKSADDIWVLCLNDGGFDVRQVRSLLFPLVMPSCCCCCVSAWLAGD